MGQQQSDCNPEEKSKWTDSAQITILGDMALSVDDPNRLKHLKKLTYDELVLFIESDIEPEKSLLEWMAEHLSLDKMICAMADLHRDHAMFPGVRQTTALLKSNLLTQRVGILDAIVLAMACQFLRGYWVHRDGQLELETRIDPVVVLKRQQARNLCILRMIYNQPVQGVSLLLLALSMGVFLLSEKTKETLKESEEEVADIYYLSVDLCNHIFKTAQQPIHERMLLSNVSDSAEDRENSLKELKQHVLAEADSKDKDLDLFEVYQKEFHQDAFPSEVYKDVVVLQQSVKYVWENIIGHPSTKQVVTHLKKTEEIEPSPSISIHFVPSEVYSPPTSQDVSPSPTTSQDVSPSPTTSQDVSVEPSSPTEVVTEAVRVAFEDWEREKERVMKLLDGAEEDMRTDSRTQKTQSIRREYSEAGQTDERIQQRLSKLQQRNKSQKAALDEWNAGVDTEDTVEASGLDQLNKKLERWMELKTKLALLQPTADPVKYAQWETHVDSAITSTQREIRRLELLADAQGSIDSFEEAKQTWVVLTQLDAKQARLKTERENMETALERLHQQKSQFGDDERYQHMKKQLQVRRDQVISQHKKIQEARSEEEARLSLEQHVKSELQQLAKDGYSTASVAKLQSVKSETLMKASLFEKEPERHTKLMDKINETLKSCNDQVQKNKQQEAQRVRILQEVERASKATQSLAQRSERILKYGQEINRLDAERDKFGADHPQWMRVRNELDAKKTAQEVEKSREEAEAAAAAQQQRVKAQLQRKKQEEEQLAAAQQERKRKEQLQRAAKEAEALQEQRIKKQAQLKAIQEQAAAALEQQRIKKQAQLKALQAAAAEAKLGMQQHMSDIKTFMAAADLSSSKQQQKEKDQKQKEKDQKQKEQDQKQKEKDQKQKEKDQKQKEK